MARVGVIEATFMKPLNCKRCERLLGSIRSLEHTAVLPAASRTNNLSSGL